MTHLPSMPLFVGDFDADTSHLSFEEDGAYNRLLRLCWRTPGCSVPDDPEWIARRMRADRETFDRLIAPLIDEFFTRSKGRIWQKRQRKEFAYVTELVEKRKSAGSRGGHAKARKAKEIIPSTATDLPEQNDSKTVALTLTLTPTQEDKREAKASLRATRFDEFWIAYPHRNGTKTGKAKARLIYERRVRDGVPEQHLIDGARAAHRHPDVIRGYARDPTTWLNAEGWTDEIGQIVPIRQERTDGRPSRLDAFLSGARG